MSATISSTTHPMTGTSALYEPLALSVGPIVVATDGTPESDATFPFAQVLASHTHAGVEAVSVLSPSASSLFAADVLSVPSGEGKTRRLAREAKVRAQMARLIPTVTPWPVEVREGDTAQVLLDRAVTHDARVIIVGRTRHGALTLPRGDLVVRLLQLGDRPIIAVDAELDRLPRRVVIGTDFSEYSYHAARIALTMVAPDAMVFLVNVGPAFEESDMSLHDRGVAYRQQAHESMARMREALQRPELHIEEAFMAGGAADELLRFADDVQADLVVSSTHGHGFIRRMLLGSVANGLLRGAQCSVMCVPGSARSHAAAYARQVEQLRSRAFAPAKLDAELSVFATRNAGRPCTVFVHHPDLGAQALGHSLRLVGATFDPHQRAASLMFGTAELAGAHLTHSVPDVSAIELSYDLEGHDRVLRLTHGADYTLVALE